MRIHKENIKDNSNTVFKIFRKQFVLQFIFQCYSREFDSGNNNSSRVILAVTVNYISSAIFCFLKGTAREKFVDNSNVSPTRYDVSVKLHITIYLY